MNEIKNPRRNFLKLGGASMAVIPSLAAPRWADAATTAAMRTSIK